MSLAKAVLEVVNFMEDDVTSNTDSVVARQLLGYARMLKVAVQAHDGAGDRPTPPVMPAELQHAVMIEKARAEFRKGKQEEEEKDPVVAPLVGGSSDGDCIPIDLAMPVGAKTQVNGQIYQLQADHKLHFLGDV